MANTETSPNTKKLLTVPEVAERCSVASETIRRLTDRGAMPKPVRLGRAVRYRSEQIDDWIESGCPDVSKRRGRP